MSGSKDNIGGTQESRAHWLPDDLVERFDTCRGFRNKIAASELFQAKVAVSHCWRAPRGIDGSVARLGRS